MPVLCVLCTRNITPERFPGIKCGSCVKVFHIKCVGASEELVKNINTGSASWICPSCRSSSRRSVIDYSESVSSEVPTDPTLRDVMEALNSMKSKFSVLETSLQYMSDTIDALNKRVSLLTNENIDFKRKLIRMERNFDDHENKLSWLEANADIPNQLRIANNIIVCGLSCDTADVSEVFINITGKIGQKISPDDITSIEKMKHKTSITNAFKNVFIITLKTIDIKNNILQNFRKHKSNLFLDEIDAAYGKTRVVLLHHFTPFQSKLYNETKKFKTKCKYRFLWCANNKILLRNLPDSDVHHIRTFCDLIRLQRCNSTEDNSDSSFHSQHRSAGNLDDSQIVSAINM